MKNIKKLEIALVIGLVFTLAAGFISLSEAANPNGKLLRLHIIAQSDSEQDQALKLKVRDAVLEAAEPMLEGCASIAEAELILRNNLHVVKKISLECIAENGFDYDVDVLLEEAVFPTREYDGFSLPAGKYLALRVIIGEGKGKNWWCVVFPPLCASAATEDIEDTAIAAGLSKEEIALITGEEGYVLRFKCLEWIEEVRKFFDKKK